MARAADRRIQNPSPVPGSAAEWDQAELPRWPQGALLVAPAIAPVNQSVLQLSVNASLSNRAIYLFAGGSTAAAGGVYWARLKLRMSLESTVQGEIPCDIGTNNIGALANGSTSLVSLIGGNSQAWTLNANPIFQFLPLQLNPGTVLYTPFDSDWLSFVFPANVNYLQFLLYPLNFRARFDQITLSLIENNGYQTMKFFLGCLSYE